MDIAVRVVHVLFMKRKAAGCDTGDSPCINCLGADNHPHTAPPLAAEPVRRCRTPQNISAPVNAQTDLRIQIVELITRAQTMQICPNFSFHAGGSWSRKSYVCVYVGRFCRTHFISHMNSESVQDAAGHWSGVTWRREVWVNLRPWFQALSPSPRRKAAKLPSSFIE